jgi:hypothetical protein
MKRGKGREEACTGVWWSNLMERDKCDFVLLITIEDIVLINSTR